MNFINRSTGSKEFPGIRSPVITLLESSNKKGFVFNLINSHEKYKLDFLTGICFRPKHEKLSADNFRILYTDSIFILYGDARILLCVPLSKISSEQFSYTGLFDCSCVKKFKAEIIWPKIHPEVPEFNEDVKLNLYLSGSKNG